MHRSQRRVFLIAAGALLAAPFATEAQQFGQIARIDFLSLNMAGNPRGTDSFRQGLRELGYVEGRNVVIEYRDAERKFERFPALAAELVALKVDVIVAPSAVASQAAKQATKTIPIVFAGVADPVALVTSLARPGGNVTGLSNLAPELVAKRLELLKEAVPGVSRVGDPLAARKWHGRYRHGHAEGRRSCGTGAGRSASRRRGARTPPICPSSSRRASSLSSISRPRRRSASRFRIGAGAGR